MTSLHSSPFQSAPPGRRQHSKNAEPGLEGAAEYMRQHALVLVTAESCTAGLIAASLADIEGAGELLDSGFITYTASAKVRCLDVSRVTLERFGLTSEPVAREMAEGALQCSSASMAVANVGVVDDIDPQIPAGTQCFAWAFKRGRGVRPAVVTETQRFSGSRREMREQAARYALSAIPRIHARIAAEEKEDASRR